MQYIGRTLGVKGKHLPTNRSTVTPHTDVTGCKFNSNRCRHSPRQEPCHFKNYKLPTRPPLGMDIFGTWVISIPLYRLFVGCKPLPPFYRGVLCLCNSYHPPLSYWAYAYFCFDLLFCAWICELFKVVNISHVVLGIFFLSLFFGLSGLCGSFLSLFAPIFYPHLSPYFPSLG